MFAAGLRGETGKLASSPEGKGAQSSLPLGRAVRGSVGRAFAAAERQILAVGLLQVQVGLECVCTHTLTHTTAETAQAQKMDENYPRITVFSQTTGGSKTNAG